MRSFLPVMLLAIAFSAAQPAWAQVQIGPGQGDQKEQGSSGAAADPFPGANPPAIQAQGGTSYYQNKQASPPQPERCDAFNRIGRSYDECRGRQLNQAWQAQQQKQSGTVPNPRLQPVDPLAPNRPYR